MISTTTTLLTCFTCKARMKAEEEPHEAPELSEKDHGESVKSLSTINPSVDKSTFSLDGDSLIQAQFDQYSLESYRSFSTIGSDYNADDEASNKSDEKAWYDLNQDINDLDDDQDVIPLHESEERLNGLCIFLALCFIILSTVFTGLAYKLFKPPMVIYGNHSVTNLPPRIPHIMILSSRGLMRPYSWRTDQTSRVKYPKLSNTKTYSYGLVSYQDTLYTLSLTNFKGITSISPNGTHRFIPKPRKSLAMLEDMKTNYFHAGKIGKTVLVNNSIWILGGVKCIPIGVTGLEFFDLRWEKEWYADCIQIRNTLLWSVPRKAWYKGPTLPKDFDLKYGCVTAYNRSTVVLIGSQLIGANGHEYQDGYVYTYDFENHKWTNHKRMPIYPTTYVQKRSHMTCTVNHLKEKRFVTLSKK